VYQWRIDDEQIIVIYKDNEKGKEEEEIVARYYEAYAVVS